MLLIRNIRLKPTDPIDLIKDKIIKRLHTKTTNFHYSIYRKSIDSRKETEYVYQVLVDIENEYIYLKHKDVSKYIKEKIEIKKVNTSNKPIIIGYGPSGMFACLKLLDSGIKSIVFEKGKRINERKIDVDTFMNKGILNEDSNIQYGEGGAGAFSDAKLTTRIKDKYIEYILDTLVKFGADKSIKYEAHPHIGSDEIRPIIERITNHLLANGVEFHFEEEVIDFITKNGKITKVITNIKEYESDSYILAIGHSSRSTIENLIKHGVYVEAKDTAIGFRVEHKQSFIDSNQYKNDDIKEPSEYFLTYKNDRNVYSFCMCPGGYVIPATSIKEHVVTNGMSNASRDSGFANSAILIQVNKEEFSNDPLCGYDYIYRFEQDAFKASNSYKALSQNIKDYIDGDLNNLLFKPTYSLGTTLFDFNKLFTNNQNIIFKEALKSFNEKIPGFIENGIMIGPETRSSSPARLKRNLNIESINVSNLYPIGEGAGYGGGIMSCSLDGIRAANSIINKYSI